MRLSAVLLAMVVVLASCSSTKKTSGKLTPPTATSSEASSSANDGSSYEKAIVIDKTNESEGVAAEYKWLRENYPEYMVTGQSLQQNNKKRYDVIHTKAKDGTKRDFYFDITKFFGKF